MKTTIHIIGSGFSSLAASCYLAKAGYNVTIFEKNDTIGGRARQLVKDGFTFDIGPSWYWMPDIFEKFFGDFGKSASDFYQLDKLSPAYKIFFTDDVITIGDCMDKICEEFERIEKGSSKDLRAFIKKAQENYDIAINKIVLKPGISPFELVTKDTVLRVDQFFKTISQEVRKKFKNPKLVSTLEFPVLFLGAKPSNTPAFYNFMNYADFGLGTWHPKGGMYKVVEGMVTLAEQLGVNFVSNANVEEILVNSEDKVEAIIVNGKRFETNLVLSGADYAHTETLLPQAYRQYTKEDWNKRVFAPSSLLFYVGFDKKLKNVEHHTLFFDVDFGLHAQDIYDNAKWPEDPLFYASFPSITDESSAPKGKEAGIFLIPLAPGIEDTEALRNQFFDKIMTRFEKLTNQQVKKYVIFILEYNFFFSVYVSHFS